MNEPILQRNLLAIKHVSDARRCPNRVVSWKRATAALRFFYLCLSLNLEKNLPKISLARGAVLVLLRRRACACDMRHAAGALANRRLDDEIARGFVEGTFPKRN